MILYSHRRERRTRGDAMACFASWPGADSRAGLIYAIHGMPSPQNQDLDRHRFTTFVSRAARFVRLWIGPRPERLACGESGEVQLMGW